MVLDGAGWHTAGDLRVPPNMHLLRLPAYSPELNPVEHIWDHLRENYMSNRVFGSAGRGHQPSQRGASKSSTASPIWSVP